HQRTKHAIRVLHSIDQQYLFMRKICFQRFAFVLLITLSFTSGCEDTAEPAQQKYPVIQTNSVTNVDGNGATFSGEMLKAGTDETVEYGFVWSSGHKPTIADFKLSLEGDIRSAFSARITFDLAAEKEYTVRAFAITGNHTVYGNEEFFTSHGSTSPLIK